MKIVEKTFDHSGLTVEFVEFEPVNREQVSIAQRDIQRHLAAINAQQATAPAKASAAYKENAA
ncbi:hypothetical protein [Stenotrophomonas sp. AB1(2024)]|uniref:hypothetical protein n=1 Tax=Stenotrophomonas sp. AB1(2024) TaxID=3132215 RepID=UPI00309B73A5